MRIALSLLLLAGLAHGDTSPKGKPPRALIWAAAGGNAGKLMLVSPSRGRVYWEIEAKLNRVHSYWLDSQIAVQGRNVIIANANTRAVESYDLRTGRMLWSQAFEGDFIFLEARSRGRVHASGYTRGGVVSLDARVGKKIWEGDNSYGLLRSFPDGIALGQRGGRKVTFFDTEGNEKWSINGVFWPVSGTDEVAILSNWQNKTIAVRVSDGKELWDIDQSAWTAEIVGDTVLLGGYYGHVTAVDLKTGNKKWAFDDGVKGNAYRLVVTGGCVLASSSSRAPVFCLDLKTGAELFRFKVSNRKTSYHGDYGVLKDRVFSKDGNKLFCRDLPKGRELWSTQIDAKITGVGVVGRTVFAATNNAIIGVNPITGKEAWRMAANAGTFYVREVR